MNAQGFCGAKDWRVPTVRELENIISFDRYDILIDTTYFPNTIDRYYYWSATPASTGGAWIVGFGFDGGMSVTIYAHNSLRIRLVRGG